eukprot:s1265_g2.t4
MFLAAVACPTGGVKKDPVLLEFTKCLSAVARASRWRKALASLQSAGTQLLQVDAFACSAAITACDRKGIWVGALQLFWRIGTLSIEADTPCFSAALGAVARSNLWEQSSLIEEERRHRHLETASATSAANLIFSFRFGGRWKNALELLADLPSRRVEADVFLGNAALATCEDAEDSALLLVSQLPALQIQPDIVSFNSAVGCCARSSSWQLGEQLLATARSSASQLLDEVSFNSLADAFDKAGEWRRASEVLQRMQSHQPAGAAFAYSNLAGSHTIPAVMVMNGLTEMLRAVSVEIITSDSSPSQSQQPRSAVTFGVAGHDDGGDEEEEEEAEEEDGDDDDDMAGYRKQKAHKSVSWSVDVRHCTCYHLQPDLFTGSSSSSAASRAQAWVSSLAIFRSTRSLGIETDMGNFNVAVSAFGRAHDWGSAMAALSYCPRPDPVTWTAVLTAVAAEGLWDLALALVAESTCLQEDRLSWITCLLCCARERQEEAMWLLLRRLLALGLGPTPRELLDLLAALQGGWTLCLALLSATQSQSIKAYSMLLRRRPPWPFALAVLNMQGKTATFSGDVAMLLVEEPRQWRLATAALAQLSSSSVRLDVPGMNSVAHSLSRAGAEGACWQLSVSMLSQMRPRSLRPSVASLTTNLDISCASNLWEPALMLMPALQAEGLRIDAVAGNVVLGGLSLAPGASRWSQALSVMCSSEAIGLCPDQVTFSAVLSACERSARWAQAYALLLQRMLGRRFVPDRIACSFAVSACSAASDTDKAMSLLKAAERSSVEVGANVAIACSASAGHVPERRWAGALSWLSASGAEDPISYGSCIATCEKNQQWELAELLLAAAARAARAAGTALGSVLCNSCISAYRRGKQWPVAMHLVASMKRRRSEVDDITVGACISCCEKAERWRWAQLSLQSLSKSSVRPSVTSFNAAVSALEKASSWGKAVQSLETMAWHSLQSDVLTQIAAVASCCRQWQLGLVLLDQLGASQDGAAAAAWPPVLEDCEHSLQPQVVPRLLESLEALERRFLQVQSRQNGCHAALDLHPKPTLHTVWCHGSRHGLRPAISVPAGCAEATPACRRLRCALRGAGAHQANTKPMEEASSAPSALPRVTGSISQLSRRGLWKEALDLSRRAEAAGLRLDTVAATSLLTATVQGPWALATLCLRDCWSRGPEPDVAMLNVIVSARARESKWREAFGAMQRSTACGVAMTCRTVVSALKSPWRQGAALLSDPGIPINTVVMNAGLAAGAQQMKDFRKRQMEPDVVSFNTAADATKLGDWVASMSLFQELQDLGLELDQVSLNTMLASCRAWSLSLDILRGAWKEALPIDVVSFASCIAACEKAAVWIAALDQTSQLREVGLRCDSICLNTAVSACCKADRWAWAVQLFTGMLQSQRRGGLAASAALAAAARRRAWRAGLILLAELRRQGRGAAGCADSVAYTAMLLACIKSSKFKAVAKLLNDMKALRLEIGRAAQNVALALQEAQGSWSSALRLLEGMRRKTVQTDLAAAVAVVGSCGKSAVWQAAVDVVSTLSRGQLAPDVAVCECLVAAEEKAPGVPLTFLETLELAAEVATRECIDLLKKLRAPFGVVLISALTAEGL